MLEQPEITLAPGAYESDRDIAEQFRVALATSPLPTTWQLLRQSGKIVLRAPDSEGGYELAAGFTEGAIARRLRTARRTDPLPRAIGMHRRQINHVIDATAGLGRDAMVLAQLGCAVTAIERVPALCFLLQVAAKECDAAIEVLCAEAEPWLRQQSVAADRPEVVYLDPMFAATGKAQVKKEMQACRALAGAPTDAHDLLTAAREVAQDRVVVKRHPRHEPLANDVSFEVKSDRVRFDVYLSA